MLHFSNKEQFNKYISNLSRNVAQFRVEKKSSTQIAYVDGRPYASLKNLTNRELKQISNQKSRSILAAVRKYIYKMIRDRDFEIETVICVARAVTKNKELWRRLSIGDQFYLLDIKHCYWRIAYLKGYISKKMYFAHRDNKSVKLARNIALSTLASRKAMTYYRDGAEFWEITCHNEILKRIYDNIRFTTYNKMGEIEAELGNQCLGYRVDGVFVLIQSLPKTKDLLRQHKFLFRTEVCTKISDLEFVTGDGVIKNF